MGLRGQDGERGYAMAALLVSLAIMSILMTVAMPVWRHEAQREKEAELAFRGEQYARAIALYRHKNGNVFPPSIDVLVQGRYLRKKYKDPMARDGEFLPVFVGGQAGVPSEGGRGGAQPPPQGRGGAPVPAMGAAQPGIQPVGAGLMGVRSRSTETSIRIYRGQNRYDMWPFTFQLAARPGGMVPGAAVPGAPGGQQQPGIVFPGGRGGPGGRGAPIGPGQRGPGDQPGPGSGGRGGVGPGSRGPGGPGGLGPAGRPPGG